MKRRIIFAVLILAGAVCSFASGKKEIPAAGEVIKVKFIVFDKKTGSGNRVFDTIRPVANRLKAGYIAGYKFHYNKDGKVNATVDASVSGKNDTAIRQEIITVNNEDYVTLAGEFEYTTPAVSGKLIETGWIDVKSADHIQALYTRLISTAIRENCKEGARGIIYPVGDLEYSLGSSGVGLKGRFLIQLN